MSEIKVRLTGWKAIAVIVAVAGFVGYRYYSLQTTLATEAAEELKFWLVSEYMASGLPALRQAVESSDPGAATALAQEILDRGRVEFTEISARGSSDDLVVRVEILVDGGAPPDGRRVRYFRMSHSLVTGWRMRRETNVLGYYLKFL